jgi:O-antigen/teichoic acid export membrane protein
VRAIAVNAISIGIVRGASVATRVFILFAIARLASPAELAEASFAIAVAEALKMFGDTGIDTWAVPVIGRAATTQDASRMTSALVAVKLLFGLVGGLVAASLTLSFGQADPVLAVTSGLFVLAGEGFGGSLIYYLSQETPHRLLPISVVSLVLIPAAALTALLGGVHSSWACAIVAVGECIVASYALSSLHASRILRMYPGLLRTSAGVVKNAVPACAYGAAIAVYMRLDALVLITFSAAAYATYAVAFRAIQPFNFAFGAVALAFYSAHVRNRSASTASLAKTMGALFVGASLVAIGAYAVCAWGIARYVPWYSDSLATLQLLCAMLPVVALNTIGFYVLASDGRFRMTFGIICLALVSEALLLWRLVPLQGARGAASALLASAVVAAVSVCYVIFRRGSPAGEARSTA